MRRAVASHSRQEGTQREHWVRTGLEVDMSNRDEKLKKTQIDFEEDAK
jgi:hypothetical protein